VVKTVKLMTFIKKNKKNPEKHEKRGNCRIIRVSNRLNLNFRKLAVDFFFLKIYQFLKFGNFYSI